MMEKHKVRLVADVHFTDLRVDSLYSGVAPLQGLRILPVMAELKNLEVLATDIWNAYLEAVTKKGIFPNWDQIQRKRRPINEHL